MSSTRTTTRKPSASAIKNTEGRRLAIAKDVIIWGNRVKKIDQELLDLPSSNVRFKI